MYVEYRHLDANPGAELAGVQAFKLTRLFGSGRFSRTDSYLSVFVIRRRFCGPQEPPDFVTDLAGSADGMCVLPCSIGRDRGGARLAHLVLVFHRGVSAIVRRTGVFGTRSDPREKRRSSERDCIELYSVQLGESGRADVRRHRAE